MARDDGWRLCRSGGRLSPRLMMETNGQIARLANIVLPQGCPTMRRVLVRSGGRNLLWRRSRDVRYVVFPNQAGLTNSSPSQRDRRTRLTYPRPARFPSRLPAAMTSREARTATSLAETRPPI